MKFGRCWKCGKFKFLTKHSPTGGHQPPFKYMCRDCHDKKHGIKPNKTRRQIRKSQKYQPGTKRQHKKGWKKKR